MSKKTQKRRPKEVEFFTCKDVTLVDLLLKSFIFSCISRQVWTQGNDSNMPSLLKIMFKIMFLYRILTHFAGEVSQLVVDCVQFSSRLCLTVLFSIRFKPLRAIRDTEENSFFTCACFAVSLSVIIFNVIFKIYNCLVERVISRTNHSKGQKRS